MWGHSQGGNSALFTAARAHSYAPELHLVATVASAPAAELVPLLNETYNSTLAWVIGPEVLTSWPATYPGLPVRPILTSAGYNNYKRIAQKCITTAAAEGLIRNAIKQRFFNGNPVTSSPLEDDRPATDGTGAGAVPTSAGGREPHRPGGAARTRPPSTSSAPARRGPT